MKRLIIVLLVAGCANTGGNSGVNPQQCKAVQKSCQFSGIYDEWVQESGEVMCSCHRMHENPKPSF
jgi:hypothetical protein